MVIRTMMNLLSFTTKSIKNDLFQWLVNYLRSRDFRNCDLPYWTAQIILQSAAELEEDVSHERI